MRLQLRNRTLWWTVAVVTVAAIGVGAYLALREPPVVKQMRETWPLSFENADSAVAVMQAVDTASLRSEKLRALHTLYLQQALYMADSPECNLERLDSLDATMRGGDSDGDRMLCLYLKGISLRERKRYADAIRTHLSALIIAEEKGDLAYQGRICREIMSLYSETHNYENAQKYAERALEIFRRQGDRRMYLWQVCEVAQTTRNLRKYRESLRILEDLYPKAIEAKDTFLVAYIKRMMAVDYKGLGDYRKTVDLIRSIGFREVPFDYDHLSYSYLQLGNIDSARYYADLLNKVDTANLVVAGKIAIADGNKDLALNLLTKNHINEEKFFFYLLKQNIAGIESDVHAADAHNKSIKLDRTRILVLWIVSIFIIILIFLFILNSRREKILKVKAENYLLQTNLLKEKYEKLVQDKESEITNLQKTSLEHNNRLFHQISKLTEELNTYRLVGGEIGSRFDTLNKLCESMTTNITSDDNKLTKQQYNKLLKDINRVINEFNSSPKKIKELEKLVDQSNDNLMSKFKESYPNLKDETKLLFLYKALNLPVITIAFLLNISQDNVYRRTAKLKSKIKENNDINVDLYLSVF